MPFKVQTVPRLNLCLLTFQGYITQADLDGHFPAMAAAPGYGPTMDEFIVFSPSASLSGIDLEATKVQMRRLLETSPAPAAEPDTKRRAIVTPTAPQLAFMRMFQALVRGHAPRGSRSSASPTGKKRSLGSTPAGSGPCPRPGGGCRGLANADARDSQARRRPGHPRLSHNSYGVRNALRAAAKAAGWSSITKCKLSSTRWNLAPASPAYSPA